MDARKRMGKVDDIRRWLWTFRENCHRRGRRSNIEVWAEVPDYEHFVVCKGRDPEEHRSECEQYSVAFRKERRLTGYGSDIAHTVLAAAATEGHIVYPSMVATETAAKREYILLG